MIKRIFATFALLVLTGATAAAQSLNACDWVASAYNVVEPWPVHTETFSNGNIRIALLDTAEPACCAFHLLVLHPDPELGRACTVVSDQPGLGFGALIWRGINATYNAGKGLRLDIPVQAYDNETGTTDSSPVTLVSIRINQATGIIDFE